VSNESKPNRKQQAGRPIKKQLLLHSEFRGAHVDADGIEVDPAAREEAHDAAARLHGDGERGPLLLPPRPVGPEVGDELDRGYHGGDAAEAGDCPGQLGDDLGLAELDLHGRRTR
jgi:hypothetical protein